MKRIARAAATALLVTVGVAGCGGTGDSGSQPLLLERIERVGGVT